DGGVEGVEVDLGGGRHLDGRDVVGGGEVGRGRAQHQAGGDHDLAQQREGEAGPHVVVRDLLKAGLLRAQGAVEVDVGVRGPRGDRAVVVAAEHVGAVGL